MTDQEFEIFSSCKKLAILKEFKGTFRTPEEVFERLFRTGKGVSKALINKVLDLALDSEYVIHERYGKRYKYLTTEKFNKKYTTIFSSSIEELKVILDS